MARNYLLTPKTGVIIHVFVHEGYSQSRSVVGYFDYATVGSRLKMKVAHYPKVHLPSTVYDRHQPIRRNRKNLRLLSQSTAQPGMRTGQTGQPLGK